MNKNYYDILSDPVKKRAYDENLNNTQISQEDAQKIYEENIHLQNELNNLKKSQNQNVDKRQIQNARQQAYHDAYIKTLRNKGYRIRYKKTFL